MRLAIVPSKSVRYDHGQVDCTSYKPWPRPPHKAPEPKQPRNIIIEPPIRTEDLRPTCLCKRAVWQFVIPSVFHHLDLAIAIGVNLDNTLDCLFFADALDLIACLEIHRNGIARRGYAVVKALYFGKSSLQTIPLRLVLLSAFGLGNRILEDRIILFTVSVFKADGHQR